MHHAETVFRQREIGRTTARRLQQHKLVLQFEFERSNDRLLHNESGRESPLICLFPQDSDRRLSSTRSVAPSAGAPREGSDYNGGHSLFENDLTPFTSLSF